MTTQSHSDQIAEAAKGAYEAIQDGTDDRPTLEILIEHFRSAIEKATEPWKQRYELALSDSQRRGELLESRAARASDKKKREPATIEQMQAVVGAAHASEQGDPWGLRDCKPDPETGGL